MSERLATGADAVASPVTSPVTPRSDRLVLPPSPCRLRQWSPGPHGGHVPVAHLLHRCPGGRTGVELTHGRRGPTPPPEHRPEDRLSQRDGGRDGEHQG